MAFFQGKFKPRNPQKYVGNINEIRYRSSWELKMFVRIDEDPSFIKWGSEEIIIPYYSPADQRIRRYFPDLIVEFKTREGEIKRAIIEIKPAMQTKMPMKPKRQTKRYLNEMVTYVTNDAKWKAATKWCKEHDMEFHIITEHELGIK